MTWAACWRGSRDAQDDRRSCTRSTPRPSRAGCRPRRRRTPAGRPAGRPRRRDLQDQHRRTGSTRLSRPRRHTLTYIKPQDIHRLADCGHRQSHQNVRLVVFKEALTTGWDCPRAEVMVSLRAAKDATYIAQLIGRMVRAPLARRIVSNDLLNRVRLYLPDFDRDAVDLVRKQLESDDGGLPTDVELSAVDAPRNPEIPPEAFATIEALPTYEVPGPVHRSQVARLHKLASLLSGDQILPGAIRHADQFLISVLDAERQRLSADGTLLRRTQDILAASMGTVEIYQDGTVTVTTEDLAADLGDIDRAFDRTRRLLRDGLADRYWGAQVTAGAETYDAKVVTIALGGDTAVVNKVEVEAADRVRQWLDSYGDQISLLSEDKKSLFAQVRAMARDPELGRLTLPAGAISMPGDESVPAYQRHLYSDSIGLFRTALGSWEQHTLSVESSRNGFVGWYRNPSGGPRALTIPFPTGETWGKLHPDFVFLHQDDDTGILQASIVDPHGHHFADAADKLRGLANYAAKHPDAFARIGGVIRNDAGQFRQLDLKDSTVRTRLATVHTKEDIELVFAQLGAAY